jgi:predicted ferric reductase
MNKTCFFKWMTLFILIAVLGGACTIPFYFESASIYYKTGMDKFMLRTGKILGIVAALLMVFQLIFIGRFSALDKIWGLKKLVHYHRINGVILLIVALIHPVLILGADHFVLFPVESKYWPEFVGVFLLVMLLLFVGVSHWQKPLGIPYKMWRGMHKRMAPVLFLLMFVHVFNVSRTFESGVPFYAAGAGAVFVVCLMIRKSFN